MRRWGALAVCIMLCAGAAGAEDRPLEPPRLAPGADPDAHRAWAARYLDMDDWMIAGFNNGSFWLVSSEKAPRNSYPIVQDWVRFEQASPLNPKLLNASALWQMEMDCSKSAYRTIRSINYRYNNLRGPVLGNRTDDDAKFSTPPPQSVGDAFVQAVCQSAKGDAPQQGGGQ